MADKKPARQNPLAAELAALEATIKSNREVIARRKTEPQTEGNLTITARREGEMREQEERAAELREALGISEKSTDKTTRKP